MPSADAPAISFNDEELQRLREFRRTFLREQGVRLHKRNEEKAQKEQDNRDGKR